MLKGFVAKLSHLCRKTRTLSKEHLRRPTSFLVLRRNRLCTTQMILPGNNNEKQNNQRDAARWMVKHQDDDATRKDLRTKTKQTTNREAQVTRASEMGRNTNNKKNATDADGGKVVAKKPTRSNKKASQPGDRSNMNKVAQATAATKGNNQGATTAT